MEQEGENMDLAGSVMQAQNSAAGDGDETDPTRYYENRLKMLDSLRSTGIDPYPHKFDAGISITDYVAKYNRLGDGEHLLTVTESLAGRVMGKRAASSKLFFYDLYGDGVKVQVMAGASCSELSETEFSEYHSVVKRGDIVGVIGYPASSGGQLGCRLGIRKSSNKGAVDSRFLLTNGLGHIITATISVTLDMSHAIRTSPRRGPLRWEE